MNEINLFDLWPDRVEPAIYQSGDSYTDMAGKSFGGRVAIEAIIDEHRATAFDGQAVSVNGTTTAYVQPDSPVASRNAIGGKIITNGDNGRTFRISDVIFGKGLTGLNHVQLILEEIA